MKSGSIGVSPVLLDIIYGLSIVTHPERITLEVAVESLADARVAAQAGADRFELCAALDVGGLTPSVGTLRAICEELPMPVFAMIRPRPGGFCHTDDELAVMRSDIESLLNAGATGVVFGVLDDRFQVDRKRNADLLASCGGSPAVFHRAIDLTPNPNAALDALMELGFKRVLTSGGQQTCVCEEARKRIAEMVQRGGDRIEVLPGSGIRAEFVTALVRETGCRQVHGAFRELALDTGMNSTAVRFGFGAPGNGEQIRRTSGALVRATRQILDRMSAGQAPRILALVSDLIFQSKISGTAAHPGVPVRCVRTTEHCRKEIREATSLLVDLTISDGKLMDFLAEVTRDYPHIGVIAFFPHVDAEIARAARAAGVAKVMTRGQFSEQLPQLMASAAGEHLTNRDS